MLKLSRHKSEDLLRSTVMFTVNGAITTSGHTIDHIQYLTREFVVTEFGHSLVVHNPSLGGRYVVDRMEARLRPVDLGVQRVQIDHLRQLVGTISVHRDDDPVQIDGFSCRRYRLCNDGLRIVIAAEAFCARVDGLAETALSDERLVEAQLHPFALPLEPDELVVRSLTRTFTNGFQHTQVYQLLSLHPAISDLATLQSLMAYPRADV